jgi:hypothetical protein
VLAGARRTENGANREAREPGPPYFLGVTSYRVRFAFAALSLAGAVLPSARAWAVPLAGGSSFPQVVACGAGPNPGYQVCQRDWRYLYRKVMLDFCGHSPDYQQLAKFIVLGANQKRTAVDQALDRCLESEFWRGKNGQLWEIAHGKVRPVGTLKQGEDEGGLPLADYYDDYALFAWSQLDDHDARDVLTADFFVARAANPTRYTRTETTDTQHVDREHRAGNLTSSWGLIYNVMFTALPRNAASQAYRSYLGLDIARQEGLFPVAGEPKDYDGKAVRQPLCIQCHATLDPLSYPFRNYNGLSGLGPDMAKYVARYVPGRIEIFFAGEAPGISQIPEHGWILGQAVSSLREWAQVAASSDAFAVATAMDYWKLLLGAPPTPEQNGEFAQLWQRLKGANQYRVKKMLHELVQTEAYGAP